MHSLQIPIRIGQYNKHNILDLCLTVPILDLSIFEERRLFYKLANFFGELSTLRG